jgi:hypothetical protein
MVAARHTTARTYSGKPGNPAGAVQPQQQRFGLIVGMVGRCKGSDPVSFGPSRESCIACIARLCLHVARLDFDGQNRVLDAKRVAQVVDEGGFVCAFCAQAMIDGRGSYPSGQGGGSKQQQGSAVRPAANRYAEPDVGLVETLRPDRFQPSGKSLDGLTVCGRELNQGR